MVRNTKKYTVITGASSGIGYETAKAFAGSVRGYGTMRLRHGEIMQALAITAVWPVRICQKQMAGLLLELYDSDKVGDCLKTKNTKSKMNKSGERLSNMGSKQHWQGINMADFVSKVGNFKTASEFSDSLVNRKSFDFGLSDPLFSYAGNNRNVN